jgi:hypothetical protein
MKTTAKRNNQLTREAAQQPATEYEVIIGVGRGREVRIPIPDGATEDEEDEAILQAFETHPDLIAMGQRIQARRAERHRRALAAAANGKTPDDAAVVPEGSAT